MATNEDNDKTVAVPAAAPDGIDALDSPYYAEVVPEDLTSAHQPVSIPSPVESLPERRRRLPRWGIVLIVVVLLAFVTTIMSAQSVGQTGIDPMEIFGLIVLLAVAAFSSASQVQLFYVAGVVAVACGLAGDVMSDFKTGAIIGTSPRAMWVGQAIGALLGTVVAVAVLVTLFSAYGPGAFGSGQMFVSAQASVVATMVSGIPSVPGFVIGLLGGIALYWAGLPAMMFGLGVYLPFYMSLTAALGASVRWVYERVCAARGVEDSEEKGVVVASGVLGGESIVGVVIALSSVIAGLAG